MAPKAAPTPPDGGYGYLVMTASWAGQVLVGSMFVGFATLMVDLAEHFQASQAELALTGALLIGMMNCFGIFAGGLIHLFGSRPVSIFGALLCTGAAVSTSFATNIYTTYFTHGIVGGVGMSSLYLSSIVILQQYFDRKRALTTGIASSGQAMGGLLVGPIFRVLIDSVGWRSTLVIQGCLMLQGAVIGATFRPLDAGHTKQRTTNGRPRWKTVCFELVDLKVFRNKHYLLLLVSCLFFQYAMATMYNLGPSRAVSQGMDRFPASLLPSTIAVCSIISRFANSCIANMNPTHVILQLSILAVGCGVSTCLSCTTASFYGSAIFAGAYGACMGGYLAIMPTVTVELVGIANVARAQGMLFTFQCFTVLFAMPISGWIYDTTSNYNIAFLISGIVALVGGCCACVICILRRHLAKKEVEFEVDTDNDVDTDNAVVDGEKASTL